MDTPTESESICGVWVDKDAEHGEKISSFIRSEMGRKVVRADVENISFVQDTKYYMGYFAVISARALKSKNHKFMVYLTSVLWRMYNLNINSNIVLVVIGKNVDSDDPQDRSLKTKGQSENLPINLRTLPRVVAIPELDDGRLREIASKLEEPSLNDSLPIGNIGIGLAWSYFYGYLALILPDMQERIQKSEVYTTNPEKMPPYFLILVPESCQTPAQFSDVDPRFSSTNPLDKGIEKSRAGLVRPYKNFVHQIKTKQGDSYYFCGEFATPTLALKKMLESKEVTEVEVNKQVVLFTHTLRTIIQSHPLCRNKALVASYADDTPGLSLADELCVLISTPTEEILPMETDQLDEESTVPTTPSTDSSFSSSLLSIGSQVIFSTIQIVNGIDGEMLADRLESFCEAAQGDYNADINNDGLDFSVKRYSSFETVDPELVNPSIVDTDHRLGGKTASDKLLIVLTEDFKEQVENIADKLIQHPVWFPRTTFIIDMPGGVPKWLEKCGADYIEMSKVDLWKRVFGSLYGVASVEGKTDERWKQTAVGKQPQKQRLPLINVAEGLAWAYYHNYLTIVGPKVAERIRAMDQFTNRKMASKLFILLPHSCYSYPTLGEADENIESDGELAKLFVNIAGNKRSYNNAVHNISVGQETYFACVEYCTPVLVMYEMEAEGLAGLSPMQKAAELQVFYDVLNTILTRPNAPDFCRDIKLIKYDDSQNPEKKLKKLSELLVDVIKENL